MPLLIIFIVIPIIELWLIVFVGSYIGPTITIFLILLTGLIGFYFLRRQGLDTIFRFKKKIFENKLPIDELFEGFLISIGGVMLILPGFITDVFGVLFLLPKIRLFFIKLILSNIKFNLYDRHKGKNIFDNDGNIIDVDHDDAR